MVDDLQEKLKMIRSNFSVGLFAHCRLRRLKLEDIAESDRVIVGEDGLYCIPRGKDIPEEVGDFYEVGFAGSPDFNVDRAAMEFAKMLLRNLTLDSFEAIKGYCVETEQLKKMRRDKIGISSLA